MDVQSFREMVAMETFASLTALSRLWVELKEEVSALASGFSQGGRVPEKVPPAGNGLGGARRAPVPINWPI